MTSIPFQFQIVIKAIVVCIVLTFVSMGDAEAKASDKCSALNQKPCPVYFPGEICDSGLDNIRGKCRPCGGANQPACSKIKRGYPCRGKTEPDSRNICRPCGGENQKACRALKPGKQCNADLFKEKGYCKPCGGLNERACPKIKRGFPCDGKLVPNNNNICNPCGGNGEQACRAMKPGEQCNANLDKDSNGTCRPCGGNGQMACSVTKKGERCNANLDKNRNDICRPCGGLNQPRCSVTKKGTICQSGLGSDNGVCRPCGNLNQPACPAMEVGRQCEEGTTNRDGYCKACGTPETGACRVTDKGSACEEVYDWKFGKCVETVRSITRAKAYTTLELMGGEMLASAVNTATQMDANEDLKESIEAGEIAENAMPSNKMCLGTNEGSDFFHRSWSLGVGADASVGIGVFGAGVSGEVGAAFRCANRDDTSDTKWYASGGWAQAVGANAGAGMTLGMWKSDFNNLRGESHGFVLSISDIAKGVALYNGVALGKAGLVDGSIGLWYNKNPDGSVGDYVGYTVTVGAGAGASIGTYFKSKTVQFCDYDMDCALHNWAQVHKRGDRKGEFISDGVVINVTGRDKEGITVDITEGGETREDFYFERATITDKRDYKLMGDDDDEDTDNDDVMERICFRHNFTELMYMAENRNCDRGLSLKIQGDDSDSDSVDESETGLIIVLGLWDFQAGSETKTDEFIDQTGDYLILRRYGTTQNRRYEKVGKNEYKNGRGSIFRFVTEDRAIWISPDKKTIYQMRKRM